MLKTAIGDMHEDKEQLHMKYNGRILLLQQVVDQLKSRDAQHCM